MLVGHTPAQEILRRVEQDVAIGDVLLEIMILVRVGFQIEQQGLEGREMNKF